MRLVLSFLLISLNVSLPAHPTGYWHGKEQELRYMPEGEDFVILNGINRFNRALYGTNTAFRVETGDVPSSDCLCPVWEEISNWVFCRKAGICG